MFTSLFTQKPKPSKVITFDDMVAPWLLQQERWRQEDQQKASSATSPSDSSHHQRGRKTFHKIGVIAIKRIATRLRRRTQKADAPTSTMAAASGAAVATPVATLVPTLVSAPPVTYISSEDVPTSSTTGPTTLPHPGHMAASPAVDNCLMQCAQGTSAHECTIPSSAASTHPSTVEPATPVTDTHLYDGSKSGISAFVLESSAVDIEPALQETVDGVFDSHNLEDERRPRSPAISAHQAPDATLEPIATSGSTNDDEIEDVSSAICPDPTPIAPTIAHPASSVTTSAAVEAHSASIAASNSAHSFSPTIADTAVEAHRASIATDGPLVKAQSTLCTEPELAASVRPGTTDGSAAEAHLASSASPVGLSAVGEVHGPSIDGNALVNATVDVQEISLVAPEVWTSCYMRSEGTSSLSDLTASEYTVSDNRRCWEAEEITLGKSDRSSGSYSPSGSFLYIPELGSSTRDATADDAGIPVATVSTDREDQGSRSVRLEDGGSESGAHVFGSKDRCGVEVSQVVGRRDHIESGYITASRTGERSQVVPLAPQGLPACHPPAQPNSPAPPPLPQHMPPRFDAAGVHPMPLHTPPPRPLPSPQPRRRPESPNWAAVDPAPLHPSLPPHPDWSGFTDGRFNMAIGNHRPLHSPPPPMSSPQPVYAPGGFNPAIVYHPPGHAPYHEAPNLAVSPGAWFNAPGPLLEPMHEPYWTAPYEQLNVPSHQRGEAAHAQVLASDGQVGDGLPPAAWPSSSSHQHPRNPHQQNNGAQTYGRGNRQMGRKQQNLAKSRDRPFDFIECIPTI